MSPKDRTEMSPKDRTEERGRVRPKTAPAHQRAALVVGEELAHALSGPWRARVWAEVSLRPMSPSQFIKEIGGERSHIALCFRQLAEWGFLELVDKRRGGQRRGGVEHVYRVVRRAIIDNETAAQLPLPVREDMSINVISNLFGQVSLAVKEGTFDTEVDRHLSYDMLRLDRKGWSDLIARLDSTLEWLPQLTLEAAERIAASGDETILTTVALAGFRSPDLPQLDPASAKRISKLGRDDYAAVFLSQRLAKMLRSPWRARILAEVSRQPMSPSDFADEFGGDLSHIARCFRQLAKAGYLEMIDRRRGGPRAGPAAVEHVYRSVRRTYIPTSGWQSIPRLLRDEVSANVLEGFHRRFSEAIDAGTFDADTDRHLSWDMLSLDRRAWTELVSRLDETLAWIPELRAEAKQRLADSGEDPITTTVALAAFRSPSPPRMAS